MSVFAVWVMLPVVPTVMAEKVTWVVSLLWRVPSTCKVVLELLNVLPLSMSYMRVSPESIVTVAVGQVAVPSDILK